MFSEIYYKEIAMSYAKIEELERRWDLFEKEVVSHIDPTEYHLPEIQKLMTASSVVDSNKRGIYLHNQFVHRLSQKLLRFLDSSPDDEKLLSIRQLWIDVLKCRNDHPLKIEHYQGLDGECSFDFTLKMMEGKSYGFKEIQILDPKNRAELDKTVAAIKRIDSIAFGSHLGGLPIMGDLVLSSILLYKETICFVAKDRDDEIIGYCLGIMLRDVPVNKKEKVNVFHLTNLAKLPDFYDPDIKFGTLMRRQIAQTLSDISDWHFVAYEHDLNHKFHAEIIEGQMPAEQETILIGQDKFEAKSQIGYESSKYVQRHFIKANTNHNYPYPEPGEIRSKVFTALWNAAPTGFDFILGGVLVAGREYFYRLTHSKVNQSSAHRIEQIISTEQQICDMNILKKIIFSEQWNKQGSVGLFDKGIPDTIQRLQKLFKEEAIDFSIVQQLVKKRSGALGRSKITNCFYEAVEKSSNPSETLNALIKIKHTPREWIDLINEERQILINQNTKSHVLN